MKNNLSGTINTISEYVFNEYLENLKASPINDIIAKIDILINNDLAIEISSDDYLDSTFPSKFRIGCKWLIKNNNELKKYRRIPEDYEFGSPNNFSKDLDPKILKLAKYTLNSGKYICQLDDETYFAMNITIDNNSSVKSSIYIIGNRWSKWYKKFNKEYKKYSELVKINIPDIIIYSDNSPATKTVFKNFDQVILKEKESIIEYIDNWFKAIPRYKKYGVIPKLSILIHGEPGTGKSTFAKAVANRFDMHCVEKITPAYFNDKNDASIQLREPTVLLLDDIDCVARSRDDEKSDDKNNEKISNLLSFLDNPPTFKIIASDGDPYDASIIIATTNFYDKLDPAVKRYGRFDKKLEMCNFDKETSQKMCDLYDLKLEDIVEDSNKKGFTISPSHLQALCFEAVDKKFKDKM